jgi:hypothetical protein
MNLQNKLERAKKYAEVVQLHKPISVEAGHRLWLAEQKELEQAVILITHNWGKNDRY